ncbi:MAG: translation initiation factor IF-2 [Thermodesulfobacteriota bacterium]
MAKIRVLDVAQGELEKEKLLAKLKKMGVKVKDEEMAEQGTPWGATERVIRDEEGAEIIEKRIKPTVIRRRARAPEEPEKIPEEVRLEAQEVVQGEVAEVLEEEKPVMPPPTEEMEGELPVEVAEELREEVTEVPPGEVMPPVQEEVKPAEVEEEEGERVKKKAKMARKIEEAGLPKKKLLKRRVVEEAELEVEKRYPRRHREQVIKPVKVAKKKVEFALPKKTVITTPKPIKRIIRVAEVIMVSELAKRMGVKANEVIKKLMELGTIVNINQTIDADVASLVASEFNYEVEKVSLEREDLLEKTEDAPEQLKLRPPVVTIMGHVDHGKTLLLDAIRKTNVVDDEAGGITQRIGAYNVQLDSGRIVFVDTPGHEAFTAMRARGAQVTDIVVLVVAADDGVMPQTIEAINHARAANVPIIVAINKIDKSNANLDKVKKDLAEYQLIPEKWGGKTIFAEVSAKEKIGITELLELILIQAEVLELKANPDKLARGTIIESRLDRGRGVVATVLVQEGTLKVGDSFITGMNYGRLRALMDDRGQRIEEAGPSTPVEVVGFTGLPEAGEAFIVLDDERITKQIGEYRQQKKREKELGSLSKVSLEELYARIQEGEVKELNLIVKADAQGSMEAVSNSLEKLSTDSVKVNIVHGGVGGISETDVNLAMASHAIIIGFNVRPGLKAMQLAEKERVDIRSYSVIYDAVSDIQKALEGLLKPTLREKILGRAEVRATFNIPKVGTVAGSYVIDGKIARGGRIRLIRDDVVIHEGRISSLKRFKEDVKDVQQGYECGIGIENFNDVKEEDVIESYEYEEVSPTL